MKKLINTEFVWFVAIGGVQFALDAFLFSGLLAIGWGVGESNVIARATAALVGYYLNQRLTFNLRGIDHRIRLLRLLGLWATLTTLSTALLAAWQLLMPAFLALPSEQVMAVGKVVVEILLVPVSFQIAGRWVYKKD